MNRNQNGFTLVELVLVIVVMGILAAVAVPKFVNLKADAAQAAVNGVAGALSSASAVNYSARSMGSGTAYSSAAAVANCADVAATLQGGLPTGYLITSLAVTSGSAATCTVTGPTADGSKTATFTALGIS